ncbi:MAG: lamin tail domain-containing protein [Tepidisphaerales bacterium]
MSFKCDRHAGVGRVRTWPRRRTYQRFQQAIETAWPAAGLRPRVESLEARQLLAADVVISEIMYHPGYGDPLQTSGYIPEDPNKEYVEIYNRGAATSLKGWQLKGVGFTFPDVTLNAGAYLVVTADPATFHGTYPAVTNYVGGNWSGHLANGGETLELEDASGKRVNTVSYATQGDWAQRRRDPVDAAHPTWWQGWHWETGADAGGKSIELINLALPNDCGQNWTASIPDGGTPGQPNSVAAANIAPMIESVKHYPLVPTSSQPVTITTTIVDEQPTGLSVTAWYRLNLNPKSPASITSSGTTATVTMPGHGYANGDRVYVWGTTQNQYNGSFVISNVTANTFTYTMSGTAATATGPTLIGKAGGIFTPVTMYDDGQHGDGAAGDGVFGATIPAQLTGRIVEYYVQATDADGRTRFWPAPTDAAGTQHGANALYQVDDTVYTGTQPIYRFVIPMDEWIDWSTMMDSGNGAERSDVQMNGAFVAINGTGTDLRYLVGLRNRGNGARNKRPHSLHLNIPNDHAWRGITGLDLNARYVELQLTANVLASLSGLLAPYGEAVQVRVNAVSGGPNVVPNDTGSVQFGSYFAFEPYDADWAARHVPDDPNANMYKAMNRFSPNADLVYLGANPATYRGSLSSPSGYEKQTNSSQNDWSDLIQLTRILGTPDSGTTGTFTAPLDVAAVESAVNVDQWMRYFAFNILVGNREGALGGDKPGYGWTDDDYSLMSGVTDPRFQLVVHDLEVTLGRGDETGDPTLPIYPTNFTSVPVIERFIKSQAFAPKYYAALLDLANTTFLPERVNALMDQLLGGWVTPSVIQSMKDFVATRRTNVLAMIPQSISITTAPALDAASGYRKAAGVTASLAGKADAVNTRAVKVNGVSATWTAWTATWSAPGVALNPGINRVLIQSFDGGGMEIDRSTMDIWYDKGSITTIAAGTLSGNTRWTAAAGPYSVLGNVTIAAGATLTIDPGTTIYFANGARMTVNGLLTAQGTNYLAGGSSGRIRFTRQPATTNVWSGLTFDDTHQASGPHDDNQLAYTDVEYTNGNATLNLETARLTLDHDTFFNVTGKLAYIHFPQMKILNSVFGDLPNNYYFDCYNMAADGWFIVDGNLFGANTGDTDVFHINRLSVKGGPSAIFTNNVFTGAGDDIIDNNESDSHVEGNLLMNAATVGGHGASAGITSGPGGNPPNPANMYTQHLTIVRNIFYRNMYAILPKTGVYATVINNVFWGNTGAILFDEPPRTDSGGGRFVDVENCIFWNQKPERNGTTATDDYGTGTFVNAFPGASYATDLLDGHSQLVVKNSLLPPELYTSSVLPAGFLQSFPGNISSNPTLLREEQTANVPVADPKYAAGFPGFADAGYLLGDKVPDARLLPGSPAIGSGINGVDMGFYTPTTASIGGVPASPTSQTSATLTIAGLDIAGYKYKITGPGQSGAWSNEIGALQTATNISVDTATGVVTLTVPGHGYATGDTIEVTGVDRECYNGAFPVTVLDANRFTYTVTQANTPFQNPGLIDIWVRKPQGIRLNGLAAGTYTVSVIRKNVKGVWQDQNSPTVATWTVNPAPPVRINEILARNKTAVVHNAATPAIIELYNPGSGSVDLSGMSLTTDSTVPPTNNVFTFPAGTLIGANQYLTLYADSRTTAGEIHLGFGLTETGDHVFLYDTAARGGALIDSVTFGLQLSDLSISRRVDGSWGLSAPTIGSANIALPVGNPAKMKINEWLADEKVLFADDFIELYNPESLPVDIGGSYLTDNPVELPHIQQFDPARLAAQKLPPLTFVAAGGLGVFKADGFTPDVVNSEADTPEANHLSYKISPRDGMIGLYDSAMKLVDTIYYGPQSTDVSQGRGPDGTEQYLTYSLPTPGVGNPGITTISNVTSTPIFGVNQVWKYQNTGNLDAVQWRAPAYNDSAWASGPGVLYHEERMPANLQGTALPNYTSAQITYYFRTHFTSNTTPDNTTHLFLANVYVDDGAVLYLNGREIWRTYASQLTAWPGYPTYGQLAESHEFDGPVLQSIDIDLSQFSPNPLLKGDNVLAVEVHQVNNASSDIVWGCSLEVRTGSVTTVPVNPVPAGITNLMSGLRITELMYDPTTSDDYQYIELQNTGSTTLDLTGVRLSGAVDFLFPAMTLAAGQYVVVAANAAAFVSRYGAGPRVAGQYTGKLAHKGERVILQLPAPYDAAMLRFDYSSAWYPQTKGGGYSLVIQNPTFTPAYWSDSAAWRASSQPGGSPGQADPAATPATVVINEFLTNPQTGPAQQWVELYNSSTGPVDVTGWYLSDDLANLRKYAITKPTVLASHEYLRLNAADTFASSSAPTPFALNGGGGALYLSSANGDGSVGPYRAVATFGASDVNTSFIRYVTSTGRVDYVAAASPTPGGPNAAPKTGPVVINEVMYHPPMGDKQYLELYNPTITDVQLWDPADPARTWAFTEGLSFAFPQGVLLPAGGCLLVVMSDPAAFRSAYGIPAYIPIYGGPGIGNLDNAGERIELSKPADPEFGSAAAVRVDSVWYDNQAPWPAAADAGGAALSRRSASAYGDDVVNWAAEPSGSPGLPNFITTIPGMPGNNSWFIAQVGGNVEVRTGSAAGPLVGSYPVASLNGLLFNGGSGNDSLTLTTPLPFSPIR